MLRLGRGNAPLEDPSSVCEEKAPCPGLISWCLGRSLGSPSCPSSRALPVPLLTGKQSQAQRVTGQLVSPGLGWEWGRYLGIESALGPCAHRCSLSGPACPQGWTQSKASGAEMLLPAGEGESGPNAGPQGPLPALAQGGPALLLSVSWLDCKFSEQGWCPVELHLRARPDIRVLSLVYPLISAPSPLSTPASPSLL